MHISSPEIKPNVLILIATGNIGGPGKGLFQLLTSNQRSDFHYTLCNFSARWKNDRGRYEFIVKAEEYGIKPHIITQYFPIDPLMIIRIAKIKNRYRNNIIQTHGYKEHMIGFFISRTYRIPWIAFAHGYTYDNLKMGLYNLMASKFIRGADKVIAVSSSIRNMLIDRGVKGSKINVIHNAVDKNELMPTRSIKMMREIYKLPPRKTVIGVVGRLGPEKGHIHFLQAFYLLLKSKSDVIAFIIGEGQERKKLETYCTENGLTDHVIFTGYTDHIADFYQIMDVLIIPSLSEGLPNVLLEAMALSVPIIATSVGGIPEVLNGENGILIPPNHPVIMKDEMAALLDNPQKRRMLVEKALETINTHFSPQIRTQNILTQYKHLLKPDRDGGSYDD